MPVERFEALTPEEFDKRLEASNERKRLEIIELEERQRKREEISPAKKQCCNASNKPLQKLSGKKMRLRQWKKNCLRYEARGAVVSLSLRCCNDRGSYAPHRYRSGGVEQKTSGPT